MFLALLIEEHSTINMIRTSHRIKRAVVMVYPWFTLRALILNIRETIHITIKPMKTVDNLIAFLHRNPGQTRK